MDQSCQTLDQPMGPCSGGSAPTVRITLHPCRDRRSPWGAEVIAARDQTTGGARRGNCRAAADRARDSRSTYTARHPPARHRAGGVVGTRFPRVRQHRVTQRRIATLYDVGHDQLAGRHHRADLGNERSVCRRVEPIPASLVAIGCAAMLNDPRRQVAPQFLSGADYQNRFEPMSRS